MYDHNARAQRLARVGAGGDVVEAFGALLFKFRRQGDVIGRVQRHRDAVLGRLLPDGGKRLGRRGDAVPALVFVSVQPARADPARRLQGGFEPLRVEGFGIAARPEFCRHSQLHPFDLILLRR